MEHKIEVDRFLKLPAAKLAALYAELTGESEVSGQEVYTPWVHWVVPHDTHMHITVKR
jgi:hypothetical protein